MTHSCSVPKLCMLSTGVFIAPKIIPEYTEGWLERVLFLYTLYGYPIERVLDDIVALYLLSEDVPYHFLYLQQFIIFLTRFKSAFSKAKPSSSFAIVAFVIHYSHTCKWLFHCGLNLHFSDYK